jgi:uncharacterized protein
MINNPKYGNLISYLKNLGSAIVAYSGGVDSTFLLVAAKEALGNNILAITINTPYMANWEIEEAIEICKKLNISHKVIKAGIIDSIKMNPPDRCYLCKKYLFQTLVTLAVSERLKYVLDGTNNDDLSDHRPGLKALKELQVKSPLLETGITKNEVREFSRLLNLPTWDKPAYACLLTRLPYGTEINNEELSRIEIAEKSLIDMGIKAVRIRSHGEIARIETDQVHFPRLTDPEIKSKIIKKLKSAGFKYITLDLEGYRMGSFNAEKQL